MAGSTKPKSIILFNRFNLASTLIGILNILLHYSALRGLAISKGSSPAGPFLGIVLLGLSYLVFWYFIYRRGNNVAKWAFVAVTAGSVALIPINLREIIAIGKVYIIADGISFVFQLTAAALLFRGDAMHWLRRRNVHHAEI